MKTFILGLPEKAERLARAVAHCEEQGIRGASVVWGINAEVAGLDTKHCYEVDSPGSGFRIGPKLTGVWLGHYMLWSICQQLPDEHFLLLEDDVILRDGFRERMEQAMADVPPNFDMLYLGNCCCKNHPMNRVKGDVWDFREPQCNHAMVVAKKAIPHLLTTQRKCYAPVDCGLIFDSFRPFPDFKVFTVLPRLCDQRDTEIPE